MGVSVVTFIGIGSNLEDPKRQVLTAFGELAAVPGSAVRARSSLYRTPPMGPSEQPDYVNAVVELITRLPPHELLVELQRIEQAHGRIRGARWGPRTLDLDLLIFGQEKIDNDTLQVPHPGLAQRAFVIVPLAEIAPHVEIPGLPNAATLEKQLSTTALSQLQRIL